MKGYASTEVSADATKQTGGYSEAETPKPVRRREQWIIRSESRGGTHVGGCVLVLPDAPSKGCLEPRGDFQVAGASPEGIGQLEFLGLGCLYVLGKGE
jgi:hypothetical protein